jgi:myosin heavy subunit
MDTLEDAGGFRIDELAHYASQGYLYEPLVGKLVYVKEASKDPKEAHVWATAQLLSHDKTGLFTASMMYDSSIKVKVQYKDLLQVNDDVQCNISSLTHCHEPGIIANIGQRFVKGKYFTAVGPDLIFVNPGNKAIYLDDYNLTLNFLRTM